MTPTMTHITAIAKGKDFPISTKHAVMIARQLRYKDTAQAKKYLEAVIAKKQAVPYYRYNFDLGHKPGMGPGRYPVKAAEGWLQVIKAVEANAQVKGLNTNQLKIIKAVVHKASIPFTGGRQQRAGKRSHLDVEVRERQAAKSTSGKATEKKLGSRTEHQFEHKTDQKERTP